MGVTRTLFLREMHGGLVTEWYCLPPPWGSTFLVADQDQKWAWLAGDPDLPIRRIFAWRPPADSVREIDCGDYQLRVVPGS